MAEEATIKFPFTFRVPPLTVSVPPARLKVELYCSGMATLSVLAAMVKLPELIVSLRTVALPVSERAEAFWITKKSASEMVDGDVPVPSVDVPQEVTSLKSVAEALE